MNNRRRPDGIDPVARSRSRRRALQAIYAWQINGANERDLIAQFAHEQAHEIADLEYFEDLVRGVMQHEAALDAGLLPHLDRKVSEVDPVERAVMRIAAYEFKHRVDVPYRVVINEGIELAKVYGATDGHKFVNGVLDKLAPRLRAAEVRGAQR